MKVLLTLWFLPALSGCSVALALNGHPEPRFDAFEVGSNRKQAEIQLGSPVSSQTVEGGKREDLYRYEIGNSPNGHRALMNLYIDLATIGLAEPILFIIELVQGHEEESRITYGPDDRILEIRGYKPPPPSAVLKEAQEAQEKHRQPQSSESSTYPSASR